MDCAIGYNAPPITHLSRGNCERTDKKDYPEIVMINGRYPHFPQTGWTPWLDDVRVAAVTPFALDGNPEEWGHTNWLDVGADGRILGWHIDPARWQTAVED